MAVILKLADASATVNYDFLTGVLRFMQNTWTTTPNMDGTYIDSVTLRAIGTDANIISAVETITELAEKCELWFNDDKRPESVWFHYSATSETAKRALVYSINIVPLTNSKFSPLLGNTGAFYQLTIVRDEAWEPLTVTTVSASGDDMTALGSTLALPAIAGSFPARINKLQIVKVNSGEPTVTKFWCGIRDTRYGTTFTPLIECETGTAGTDTASASADTTGSPGGTGSTTMRVTWSTTTLTGRLRLNPFATDNWVGRYMVLLRHKANASQSVGIQLATGYGSAAASLDVTKNAEVIVTATTQWQLTELGEVTIPPSRYSELLPYSLENVFLRIYAERLTAGTYWDMDCIILIPMDHYCSGNVNLNFDGGGTNTIFAFELHTIENGEVYTLQTEIGKLVDQPRATTIDWFYPIEGGKLVFAFDNATGSHLTEEITLYLTYYTRHRVHHE
jgi:hypothetical protein